MSHHKMRPTRNFLEENFIPSHGLDLQCRLVALILPHVDGTKIHKVFAVASHIRGLFKFARKFTQMRIGVYLPKERVDNLAGSIQNYPGRGGNPSDSKKNNNNKIKLINRKIITTKKKKRKRQRTNLRMKIWTFCSRS